MSNQSTLLPDPIRPLPDRRPAGGKPLCATLILILVPAFPVLGAPPAGPSETPVKSEVLSRPAPNQSIALDDAVETNAPPVWPAAPSDAESGGEPGPAAGAAARDGFHLPPRSADSRRTASLNNRNDSPRRTETPWYATGLGSLTIVLALVAALFLLLRRWAPGAKTSDSGVMRVAARLPLGARQQLVLVQVGRRLMLAGIAGDNMSSLGEISEPDEVAELLARCGRRGRAPVADFDDAMQSARSEYEEPAVGLQSHPAAPAPPTVSGERPVTELLKRVRALHARRP